MNYNIFNRTAPAMPKPSKGTEIVKLLLSQVSKDIREPLLPMTIPALAAHVADAEFMYSDNKYYELCGQMGHLIGHTQYLNMPEVEMVDKMCGGHSGPGERLFLQLKELLPNLEHHQLPPGCKDFSEYYLQTMPCTGR